LLYRDYLYNWITESFRRWLKFRRMKRIYKERDIVNEANEEINLIQKQVGEG